MTELSTPVLVLRKDGMVAAEKDQTVWERVFGGVGEFVGRPACNDAGRDEVGEVAVPGYLAEADDDPDAGKLVYLRGRDVGCRCVFHPGVGLSPGGAQRTTEPIQASRSWRPSSRWVPVG